MRITLRDKTVLVRRFNERHARTISVYNEMPDVLDYIPTRLLRNVSIYRQPPTPNDNQETR